MPTAYINLYVKKVFIPIFSDFYGRTIADFNHTYPAGWIPCNENIGVVSVDVSYFSYGFMSGDYLRISRRKFDYRIIHELV